MVVLESCLPPITLGDPGQLWLRLQQADHDDDVDNYGAMADDEDCWLFRQFMVFISNSGIKSGKAAGLYRQAFSLFHCLSAEGLPEKNPEGSFRPDMVTMC